MSPDEGAPHRNGERAAGNCSINSRDGKLMVVTLKPAGTSLEPSLPRELFQLPTNSLSGTAYEAAPDGQRFLANDIAASPDPLTVIVNWPALLKKGAAAP